MTRTELTAAKLAACAGLGGALLGGLASLSGTYLQTEYQAKSEIRKIKAEVVSQDRKIFLAKSEALFASIADLVSFFDTNHRYEAKDAKPVISRARKAAFEFAVYTSPEMALKALSVVEAVNVGADANDNQKIDLAMKEVEAFAKELTSSFYPKRDEYDEKLSKALK